MSWNCVRVANAKLFTECIMSVRKPKDKLSVWYVPPTECSLKGVKAMAEKPTVYCSYCHVALASQEKATYRGDKPYHPHHAKHHKADGESPKPVVQVRGLVAVASQAVNWCGNSHSNDAVRHEVWMEVLPSEGQEDTLVALPVCGRGGVHHLRALYCYAGGGNCGRLSGSLRGGGLNLDGVERHA